MTQAELQDRIAAGVRRRRHTISEIAAETGQPEDNIRPAIAMLQTEGLVRQEGDHFYAGSANPNQLSSASVQNVSQQVEESQPQDITDVQESEGVPQQGTLIKKFMAALKAAQEAGASVLSAEKASCVRHHRLGKIAVELKATFVRGEWGKFLQQEKLDQNRINRAMRIATYLTESQCERLPILAAERLIKKIRDYRREHGANPSTSRLTDMVIEATMDYENGRLQQAKKAGESAVVDLVDPQVGHFYRDRNGDVCMVTEMKEDALIALYPGGEVKSKLVSFCAEVDSETCEEEFQERMAAWEKDRKKESEVVQDDVTAPSTAPVESKVDEETEDARTETVRFYERQGLLDDPPRRQSGYREYGDEAVAQLRFIKRAKRLGFTLKEIKELLSLHRHPATPAAEVKQRAEAKIADIEMKVNALQRMKRALVKLTTACSEHGTRSQCPLLAALGQADDVW